MHTQEDFFNGHKGMAVFRRAWLPDCEPMAAVLVVHGLAEHSGRYQHLAEHLVEQGCAVYSYDHMGHGRSEGPRCHADSFNDFLENLNTMVQWARLQHKGKPLFLFGHSMGGLIAASYLLAHQREVTATILSSPALMPVQQPGTATRLKAAFFKLVNPKAPFSPLDPNGVSRDPGVVEDYKKDPLVHHGAMSVGLALALGGAMGRVRRNAGRITLPVLVVQGGKDVLVNPAGAEAFVNRVGSANKQLVYYPQAYHEVLNEPEAAEFLELLDGWLRRLLPDPKHERSARTMAQNP
ncbi:alpha/beta hydrolase [Gilvimarinus sp. F26214L]|uniref:alpha/beta hydrolase n=1 Tax=Gilvimarinus sp. DZF01 TaxID=3461371 RepID=UPI0040461634